MQGAADDDGSQPVTTVDGEGATGLDLVEVFCDATDIARKYQQGETEVTIPLVVLAIVCDTVFGVLRAIKEKKFNSCAGIDGAIRKVGMLISLVFMLAIDVLIKINLIGFIPEQARTYLGLDTVGVAEFFALLYIAYEVVSIFKNMALCGLPVKKVWEKVREFLAKYTDELPDTDELDGDRTTGNVEEHRTQER